MKTRIVSLMLAVLLATAIGLAQSSGVIELISRSSAGVPGNASSGTGAGFVTPSTTRTSVSADGRFVAFMSFADNLVPGDTNGVADVFVRDRVTGTTERVSVTSRGREGNGHSGLSETVGISADGRYVAFDSEATNLARGDDNANAEVFVHDRVTRVTELISRTVDGGPGTGHSPSISADGRFVAFISGGQELVAGHPEFNFFPHAYVYDRQTQVMERVDVDPAGELANGQANNVAISGDGQLVAFDTFADDLVAGAGDQNGVDVFVRNRATGTTEGISTIGDSGGFEGNSSLASISSNGRFVGFSSADSFAGDANGFIPDALVFDRVTGTVHLVNRSSAGVQADSDSETPFASDDGTYVVFSSRASNLVAGDTNESYDVFRRNLVAGTTERIAGGDEVNADSIGSGITPDGLVAAVVSEADLLETGDNLFFDVFVVDLRPAADLAIAMNDSPDPVTARGALTYTITVHNAGPGTAESVVVSDTLPADAVFVSATSSQGSCTRTGKGKGDGTVTCQLDAVAAGNTVTISIVVSPSTGGVTLTNTATVLANTPDPQAANNSATQTTTVNAR